MALTALIEVLQKKNHMEERGNWVFVVWRTEKCTRAMTTWRDSPGTLRVVQSFKLDHLFCLELQCPKQICEAYLRSCMTVQLIAVKVFHHQDVNLDSTWNIDIRTIAEWCWCSRRWSTFGQDNLCFRNISLSSPSLLRTEIRTPRLFCQFFFFAMPQIKLSSAWTYSCCLQQNRRKPTVDCFLWKLLHRCWFLDMLQR